VSDGSRAQWPLWEVFVRSGHGLAHKHVGSLHAADEAMALQNARDVYTRRSEGASLWVVRASDIVASDPSDRDALFAAAEDKPYRQPTHYVVPEGVKNL
jgi:ring-1,2-phenylacetyl-CoA epoxidase subunit PaaB